MHRFSQWFLGWILIGSFACTGIVQAGVPSPTYLTVRNGLPQGFVKSLIQDRRGFIWLATRDGLCRYDGVRFRVYTQDPHQRQSLSFSSIFDIKEDNRGKLWVSTENNTIDRFDPITERVSRVSDSNPFRQALNRNQITSMQPDRLGNVWIATQTNGFFQLHPDGSVTNHYWAAQGDTIQRVIRSLLLDKHDRLWIAARDGLFRYDPVSGAFTGYRITQGLPQNDVFRLHERANGQLMLGFPGRFALFDPTTGRVQRVIALPDNAEQVPLFTKDQRGTDYINQHHYTDQTGLVEYPADPKLLRFAPLSLLVDRSNVLWIGLNGDGIITYNLNKAPFTTRSYTTNFQTDWMSQVMGIPASSIPAAIQQQVAATILTRFDGRKKLWVSSPITPPFRYDSTKRLFDPILPAGIEPRWLPGGVFRLSALATGQQGEMWGLVGPHNRAVVRHNPAQATFTAFPLPLPANHPYEVMAMLVDGGRIYFATRNHGLLRADLSSQRLVHWYADGSRSQALPNNSLLCLAQDPAQYNHVWIGTFGSGLCRLDKLTGKIRQFTVGQGLPNNVIFAIRPDGKGHLWLSTNRGLCRFDSRTFEVRNYTADDGLPNEEFNRGYDVALPDGRFVFGGAGGYTVFDPLRVSDDGFKPLVALTALRINNLLVSATNPDSPIRQDINETSEINLNHHQNFLSFDFAALQFNQSSKNLYRYKLTGLDNDWIYSGNQATATYTNLPPGTYTFVVNASNTAGVWSPHTHRIRILIAPPIWTTWWAYVLYGLLVLGGIIVYLSVRINRMHLKSDMELRKQESLQLKKLDEVKSRFFANITHEFRTPLTLILSPLEELLDSSTDSQQRNRLTLVYRNAGRLLRLINELLDLAKLEAGNLPITHTPGDLAEFIERNVAAFEEESRRNQVTLRLQQDLTQPFYWFDAEKVEKIVNNLLSNALKFTGPAGSITVTIATLPNGNYRSATLPTGSDLIRLTVKDTGTGIADHKLPYIFNRFYQASQSNKQTTNGSGIGLALVKELVEMMNGTISVESRSGLGSTFTVDLPCRPARSMSVSTPEISLPATQPSAERTPNLSPAVTQNAPQLLLVEDNDDIADYIIALLGSEWQLSRVSNGQAGIDAALATGPDLIISDVLMPQVDGYELCRQLKRNPITSHIPILLLTAKSAAESRLEGLNAGADDYITKPFQVDELRGRVRNRLEQQQRMRAYYRTQLLGEGRVPTASPAPQDDFMNQVYTILESRFDDSTFGVEPLADALGMSRMHLNRKIKAMTGLSPNELIRAVRLNRAADLLQTGAPISDVAYMVGFDTPAYFSKVFKDYYQLTPSDFVEKARDTVL